MSAGMTSQVVATLVAASSLVVPLRQTALADTAQVRTQAPGFYRMLLGDIEITALSDGTFDLPLKQLLTNTTPDKVDAALARSFLADPVETSVNAYLINTGAKLVLVDTGAGAFFGPTVGKLINNLRAAGYAPEQVDAILITHMHADHSGGLVAGDSAVFPNATVHFDRREGEQWLDVARMNAVPEANRSTFKAAIAATGPYAAAGRLRPFDGDTEIVPGVRAVAARGHTPGHTIYVVESRGQRLALWGDLMHVAAVQFPDPTVTIRFDSDSPAAAARRQAVFAEAAADGRWIAAAHLPFPGIGHIRAEGSGYTWVPANYASIR